MNPSQKHLLAFYGDDFTGSTDALEFMNRVGAETVLFMNPPTPEQLSRYEPLTAIGVAGRSRTMTPEEMEEELRPALTALKKVKPAHVHYKVCSTFDSSPDIGSIGKAIDIATEIYDAEFVPLLVASPVLGRYCTFGNLFARMGIGSDGAIYRLDRHPSMRNHPTTPADESDLRLHLGRQTSKMIGLVDVLEIDREESRSRKILESRICEGNDIILFDALREEQMPRIGRLIDTYGTREKPLFSVGSSGIEAALGQHWVDRGILQPRTSWKDPGPAKPLLVASGSRSPVTTEQISWAVANGFKELALDTETIARDERPESVVKESAEKIIKHFAQGRNVIIHTCFGDEDSRIEKTKAVFERQGMDDHEIRICTSRLFGTALGQIVGEAAGQVDLKRVVFAGGDTSSYAARTLGIEALQMIAPISPGSPLCKISAPNTPVDGLEVNFKGGQVGTKEYFGMACEGRINP